MNSVDYNMTTLVYPREVGSKLLPFGLPQGRNLKPFSPISQCERGIMLVFFPYHVTSNLLGLAGLGEEREITDDQIQHIQKFLPVLRYPLYGLERCADFLESWISGSLPAQPLLDVSAPLGLGLGRLSVAAHSSPFVAVIWTLSLS